MTRPIAVICLLGLLPLGAGAATSPAPGAAVTTRDVRTIVGSGKAGIADGPATSASFLMPSAIARAADGTLYVTDEAAQRVRAIHRDGSVETVAGSGEIAADGLSVQGGYREGPALQALFNRPNGIAVGGDGAVYISDRRNACIRKLEHGVVAPYAGRCGDPGANDGAAGSARLKDPRAIVFDQSGALYVADYGVGIRVISPAGAISTLKFHSTDDTRFWGVGLGGEPKDPTLVASTQAAIVSVHLATHQEDVYDTTSPAEGNRPFGNVNQMVGIDHREFLFTDVRSNNVRYLRLAVRPFATTVFTRTIAGGGLERQIDNAGFVDGSREASRFFVPRGITVYDGVAYVADSGNRRIRAITLPNFRLSEAGFDDTTPYDTAHYEILYIGASWAYWDSLGDESICARLEAELNAAHKFSKPVRCHPVRIDAASFGQIEDYLANYLQGHVDLVVLNANLSEAFSLYPNSAPPSTAAAVVTFRQHVSALQSRLAKAGPKLLLLWNEDADDVTDTENYFEREGNANRAFFPVDLRDNYWHGTRLMIDAVASLPVFEVDTYADFLEAEHAVPPPELFGTDDSHMTPRGSGLMAHLLARYIIGEKAL